jgi:mannonate dehydratase
LMDEEQERKGLPPARCTIPMRPDHGHTMGAEKSEKRVRPGYSYAGRMKGLAELRGVIHALNRIRNRRYKL